MHLHAVSFALHSLFQHRNGVVGVFMHDTAVHALSVLAQRWSLHLTGESAGHEQFLGVLQAPSQHTTLGLRHHTAEEHSLAELAHLAEFAQRIGLF